jgi:phosphatidylglycerol:prolipoprotein diacylglycerol transferase
MSTSQSAYAWLMIGGIIVTICFWWRLARRDARLLWIYLGALSGAFIGAKIVYFLAEGWMHLGQPDVWVHLATGKTILGALLGGYAGVELVKSALGYAGITGDWFALVAPVGIALGRVGCWSRGCCSGILCAPAWYTLRDHSGMARWPSVPLEIVFNLAALAAFLLFLKRGWLKGQHFHLYLIGYGIFRFLHEFLREEPRIIGPFSGYHFGALVMLGFGLLSFARRQKMAAAVPAGSVTDSLEAKDSRL